MYDATAPAERAECCTPSASRRFPELRETVAPILFLASAQSSDITAIVLDGYGGRFMPL